MDKSIIAYPLKILVSIEIFDLKVPFFTIFLYIGYGPLTNDFIGLVTLEFVGLFQLIVAFLSAFDADGNVSF